MQIENEQKNFTVTSMFFFKLDPDFDTNFKYDIHTLNPIFLGGFDVGCF